MNAVLKPVYAQANCTEKGCTRAAKCRQMCSKHYQRWLSATQSSYKKRPFSVASWNRMLEQLNAPPDEALSAGIKAFRRACQIREAQFAALRDIEIAMETQL